MWGKSSEIRHSGLGCSGILKARQTLRLAGRRGALLVGMAWLLAGGAAFSSAQDQQAGEPVTLVGRVIQREGQPPVLRVEGKDVALAARVNWILNTLRDKPLANREIRAEGLWLADGTLKINHFWTVRDGKLYRVRYFCEVCNIEAFEPGKCVCCQEPVEFQEIPLEKSAN